ncbi:hypothetical protein Zm00014a_020789, partial [Zea mays]
INFTFRLTLSRRLSSPTLSEIYIQYTNIKHTYRYVFLLC